MPYPITFDQFALPALRAIPFAGGPGTVVSITSAALVCGWALVETSGVATASLSIVNGGDANGAQLVPFTLAANESVRDGVPGEGLYFDLQVSVLIVTGNAKGTIWVRDL